MSEPFITAKLSGASEIGRVLDQLPRKLGEKALNAALRKGARVVLVAAKARAHKLTGDLRKNIRIRKLPRSAAGAGAHLVLELAPKGFYGLFHEFGTATVPAHPFMRPAFDENAEKAIAVIGAEAGRQVTVIATRLAGSFAKSGLSSRKRRRRR